MQISKQMIAIVRHLKNKKAVVNHHKARNILTKKNSEDSKMLVKLIIL